MKKLMMTTVAALGFAVCAQAADDGVLNKTGFEDYGSNSFKVNATDTGATEGDQFWTGDGSADFTQTVLKTYAEAAIEAPAPAKVPDAFTNAANTTFLSVDTGNAVMYRRAAANPTETIDLSSAGPVFFDADVKFTASETAVVPSEGDKLLVWLKGDETTTNLIVTAGLYNESTEEYDQTNFTVDGDYAADTWYRLTVKATSVLSGDGGNNTTAFNVYVDGELVTSGDTDLFYSLVQQTDKLATTIAEAGFQGTGALDNVVWTTTDPFYVETEEFTVNVTLTDDGGAVGEWTFNGEDVSGETEVTTNIEVAVDAEIVVALTVYESVTVAATLDSVAVAKENITSAASADGEGTVYTITLSGADYVDGDTAALAITVTKSDSPTPEDTTEINADGKGYVADETGSTYTKAAVEAMVTVVAPNADSLSEEAKAAYNGYFTKNATYNADTKKWEVTVALNETALDADVDAAVEAALEAVEAGATSVALPAGFYYKVESGSALPIATTATGTTDGSKIEVKGLSAEAGFYKVSLDVAPIAE